MVIRSYRRVFEVDRRIYRVDRWALPVPGGVPLRAVGYFVTALLVVLAAGALPGLGDLVTSVSPPFRFVVIPLAVAVLATQAAPDGRAAHRFALAWFGLRLRARRRSSGRVVPLEGEAIAWHHELPVRWDGSSTGLRRGRVIGPARITFLVPVRFSDRGGRLVARSADAGERGQFVVVCGGTRLEVRP